MTIRETLNRLIRALKTREKVELPRAELSGLSPEIAALADPSKQESAELAGKLNHLAEVVEELANIEIPDEVDEDEGDDQRIELLEQQIYLLTEQVALLLPEDEDTGSEPLIAHDRGRVRVGKIDSHSGSGVYVVTQQEWSSSAWQAVPTDHPMYQVSVRDKQARTAGAAADIIIFWQQLDSSGETELVADLGLSHLGLERLTDPGADRILFWDDSAGKTDWLTSGTNLSITGMTLDLADPNAGATLDDLTDGEGSGTWTAAASANGVEFIAVTDLDRVAGAIDGWWYRTFKCDEKGRLFSVSGATYISS